MINEDAIKSYIKTKFKDAIRVEIAKIGSGVQGSGFLVAMETSQGEKSYVVKGLFPEGLGHDYPSDRASVFLLDMEDYAKLPCHVKAVDVLAEMPDGTVKSIGGGKEYYLLMERCEGTDYFNDLKAMVSKSRLDENDKAKIRSMAKYLAEIHSVKKDSRTLYWRKIRDIIGHGECLMGVFDTYPDGTISYDRMAVIEKLCIDWRAHLKPNTGRLSQIHGDFHPGNIWFQSDTKFILLDRSRGAWGDPADDITALSMNYIFFSLREYGDLRGACKEGFEMFFDEYVRLSGDSGIFEVLAPFYAFRGAVVANPVFYNDVPGAVRDKIFNFVTKVLKTDRFDAQSVNTYLEACGE
ncbi:MAG: aminoglycoside phosphotransferase family protein [Nitrospirae bacterium]|nr:MAG: aminoglycoside phosphotransferase family protein [Nitrospirota bacterium]